MRRIVLDRYGRYIRSVRLEPEDVLSAMAVRILAANEGSAPFDPQRSDAPAYICLQAESTIRDLRRPRRRWDQDELTPTGFVDANVAAPPNQVDDRTLDRVVDEVLVGAALGPEDRPIVRLYVEGHGREDIVAITGRSQHRVITVITSVRRAARGAA